MTRKDIVLASSLKATQPADTEMEKCEQWNKTLYAIADSLRTTNPRFDYHRFVTASHRPIL